MKIKFYLEKISKSNQPYIIYKSQKGFKLYTNFSKKIILSNKNIVNFLKKIKCRKKNLKKTDLYIGFFGYEILNYLIKVKLPKQKTINFPKGIFYKPETLINLTENLPYRSSSKLR